MVLGFGFWAQRKVIAEGSTLGGRLEACAVEKQTGLILRDAILPHLPTQYSPANDIIR